MDLNERIALENSLDKINYRGIPIGSLICHKINNVFFSGGMLKLSEIYKSWSWTLKKITLRETASNLKKYCLVLASDDERYHKIMMPVKNQFTPDEVSYVYIQHIITKISILNFISACISVWYYVFKNRSFFKSSFRTLDFKGRLVMYNHIAIQLMKCHMIKAQLLKNKSLKHIMVDWDRQSNGSLIVLTAQSLGIKTSTAIHGSTVPPQTFIPFIADTCYGWGKMHEDLFKDYDLPVEKLVVTGSSGFDLLPTAENTELYRQYGISETKKVFLFISQNYADNRQFDTFRDILSAVDGKSNIQIVFKPHPADKLDKISDFKKKTGSDFIVLPKTCTVAQAMSLSDVILIMGSTFIIDAAIARKHIAVYNPYTKVKEIGDLAHEKAGIVKIKDLQELKTVFEKAQTISLDILFNTLALNIEYLCSAYGNKAAINIANYIKKTN